MKRSNILLAVLALSIISSKTFAENTYAKLEMGPQFPTSLYPEYNKAPKSNTPRESRSNSDSTVISAQKGNIDAQVALGLAYLTGDGRSINEPEAFRWFKLAEKDGSEEASVYLASMYYYGQGTKRNYEEAFKRFNRAAESGNGLAQFNLHTMYDVGYGVLVDKEKALYWLKKSAESGFTRAQSKLGMLYKTGGGLVNRNLQKAIEWLHRAADNGDKEGQFQLAKIYAMGIGARKNNFISYVWFNIAGENCEPGVQLQQCMDYTRSIATTLTAAEIHKANRLIHSKKKLLAQKANSPTFEKVIIH